MQELQRAEGNRDSTLGVQPQQLICTGTQHKSSTSMEPELDLPSILRGSSSVVAHCGDKNTGSEGPKGILISVSSPGGTHFSTNIQPNPKACRSQC